MNNTTIRHTEILSADQLRRQVPSAYATTPYDKMSQRYRMVPTSEVFGMLQEQGFEPVRAAQSKSRTGGRQAFTKHVIRFRHMEHMAIELNEEAPELVLMNSHDGTSAYRFMAGIFRLICSNGLTVQSADFGSISVKHAGGTDFRNRVIDATYEVMDAAPKVMNRIQEWKQIDLSNPQREAFAAAVLEARGTKTEISPQQMLRPRRAADTGTDLWTTANVVQENSMKGGLTGTGTTGRQMKTRAIKSVGEDVKTNRAIWLLTEKMAELMR